MPSKNGENRFCEVCKKEYYVSAWRLKRGNSRFCGNYCQNFGQYERHKFKCFFCKKECQDSPSRKDKRKFCSRECLILYVTLKKDDARKRRREAMQRLRAKGYRPNDGPSRRKYALENKENECMVCGYKEYLSCLDVHHIDNDPSNNLLSNLCILCVMCHRKVHRKIINLSLNLV